MQCKKHSITLDNGKCNWCEQENYLKARKIEVQFSEDDLGFHVTVSVKTGTEEISASHDIDITDGDGVRSTIDMLLKDLHIS